MSIYKPPGETEAQRILDLTGYATIYRAGEFEDVVIDSRSAEAHLLAAGGEHGVTIRPDGSVEPATKGEHHG